MKYCKTCGKEIPEGTKRRVFCSKECFKEYYYRKRRKPKVMIAKTCWWCGEKFYQLSGPGKPKSLCSEECKRKFYESRKKGRKIIEQNPNFIAESLDYELCQEGAVLLASAIICTTAADYKQAVRRHLNTLDYRNFFRSDWFQTLTAITTEHCDGERVIELIEGENNKTTVKNQIGERGSGKCSR